MFEFAKKLFGRRSTVDLADALTEALDIHLEPVKGETCLSGHKYGYPGPIAIIEAKHILATYHRLAGLDKSIDPIYLTLCQFSEQHPMERIQILVWDKKQFLSDPMHHAVIAHEVGHAKTGLTQGLEAEIAADAYACTLGYVAAMRSLVAGMLCEPTVKEMAHARLRALDDQLFTAC